MAAVPSAPLTVLDDAVLLQGSAQVDPLAPALHLPILKEPVDELAAGEGAVISHAVFLSQLHDRVFVCDETGVAGKARMSVCKLGFSNVLNEARCLDLW